MEHTRFKGKELPETSQPPMILNGQGPRKLIPDALRRPAQKAKQTKPTALCPRAEGVKKHQLKAGYIRLNYSGY